MVATRDTFPLLAELLAEQQRLDTPVARFSSAHDTLAAGGVALAPQLIPLTKPGAGEQYAFEVDLDSCTGCKSCVAACHSLNGLDDTETWRDVGLLVSESRARPFTQTVTTACHHCADPACLNGCPVLAYEKDPVTGVVVHLDDQCIGCSYCVLKCPYDVPKFSERLGIVRKCDMCHSRLSAGEAPACAQACPTHAIRIVTVTTAVSPEETARASTTGTAAYPDELNSSLPGTPAPSYTRPTTRYVTRRKLPEHLIAGDAATLRIQPAHWPLVIMLTLIPIAVGLAIAATAFSRHVAPHPSVTYYVTLFPSAPLVANNQSVTYYVTLCSWLAGAVGLAASVFHLGQPMRAWRIFLGWRKSWLSREAMVFGPWFGAATAALFSPQLIAASASLGVVGLGCSAMIYVDTRRRFWRASQTFTRFFGTAAVVGLAPFYPLASAAVLLAKLGMETRTFFDHSASSRLQRALLPRAVLVRDGAAISAVLLLVAEMPVVALPLLVIGESAERYLFFRAVDAPKMPGMPG